VPCAGNCESCANLWLIEEIEGKEMRVIILLDYFCRRMMVTYCQTVIFGH
jgi:mRNA-degrading endonuclease HigB of HigAB toxin-antitoxin module